MFWATPIAVHNIVLALFKFLLSCAVGSILAIHSRFGDKYAGGEYAISIRWISKSDYLEMFHSARNSRKRVPTLTTFIMAFTIIISFVASNMDKLVTKYIHRSTALRDSSFIVTNSSQFTQFFSASTKFAGWTASIPYGANITDALTLMINDTRNIPDVNSRQVYTPRTFEYEIECDRFNAFVLDKGNDSMLLQNGGCTTGYFLPMLSETMDLSNVTIKKVSSGWWSMATPATPEQLTHLPSLMGSIVSTATDEWQCGSPELNVDLLLRPQFGLAAYPTTRVTKCILPSGEIRVLSVSTVQFSAFSFMIDEELLSPQLAFGISARMTFTEYDDLIQAMEYSISNVTFSQNATVLLEVKLGGPSMDIVICSIAKFSSGDIAKTHICSYVTTDAFTLKPQEVNPLMNSARNGRPYSISYNLTTSMAINYIVSQTNVSTPFTNISSSSELVSMDNIRSSTV